LAPAGLVFIVLLPISLLRLGARLDRRRGWRRPLAPALRVVGAALSLGGWLLGVWTNYVQFTAGRGTPVPVMATQELIVRAPYAYCRNPMALGAILAYLGLGVVAGSRGAVLLVAPGAAALLAYIKLIEEREMVARFGDAYLAYRRRVPFLLPSPWSLSGRGMVLAPALQLDPISR
jgi:protein-S-isoprenylcysteine O-methyltransferase Ste14